MLVGIPADTVGGKTNELSSVWLEPSAVAGEKGTGTRFGETASSSSVIKFLCSVPERRCLSDFSVVGQRGKLDDRHFRSGGDDQDPAAKSLRGMAKSILTNRLRVEQQVFTQGRVRTFSEELPQNGKAGPGDQPRPE